MKRVSVVRLPGASVPVTTSFRRSERAVPAGLQAAFWTLPALRQRVQTYSRRGEPPTSMRTFWRFGLKRRRVATMEWLRLFPNEGPLLHT